MTLNDYFLFLFEIKSIWANCTVDNKKNEQFNESLHQPESCT